LTAKTLFLENFEDVDDNNLASLSAINDF